MLANVLNTGRAIEVSVYVVRAFVKLREMLVGHAELARQIAELETKYGEHDKRIALLLEAIRELMKPVETPKKGRIGFAAPEKPAT